MNPIRALLWKEGREAAYKMGAGSCVALLLGLLYLHPVFYNEYPLEVMSHLVGLLAAVLLGMDLVAGERSRGTLPLLLSRPLAPGRLLGVKFAVGAAGMLALLASFWAGVYLGLPGWGKPNFLWWFYWDLSPHSSPNLNLEEILQDVGFARILLLWFFLHLVPYTLVFLSSAFTDRPLKAVAVSLLVAWVGLFVLGTNAKLFPAVWFFVVQVFHTDLENDAGILRQAFEPSLLLARIAGAALMAGGVLLWSLPAFQGAGEQTFPVGRGRARHDLREHRDRVGCHTVPQSPSLTRPGFAGGPPPI